MANRQLNNHNDKQLEAAIDQLLKALPPMRAPETLIARVLASLTPHVRVPWYRRTWQTWPAALQLGTLAVALASSAGLYVCITKVILALRVTYFAAQLGSLLGAISTIHQAFKTLTDVTSSVLHRLDTEWVLVCGLLALLSYAACVGLGTVFARVAWAQNSYKRTEP